MISMPWCRSGSIIESSVVSWPPCRLAVEVNTQAGLPASAPRCQSSGGAVEEVLERRRHVAEAGRAAEREAGAFLEVAQLAVGRPSGGTAARRLRDRSRPAARCAGAPPRRARARRPRRRARPCAAPSRRRCSRGRGSPPSAGIIEGMEKDDVARACRVLPRGGAALLRGPRAADRGQPDLHHAALAGAAAHGGARDGDRLPGVRPGDRRAAGASCSRTCCPRPAGIGAHRPDQLVHRNAGRLTAIGLVVPRRSPRCMLMMTIDDVAQPHLPRARGAGRCCSGCSCTGRCSRSARC